MRCLAQLAGAHCRLHGSSKGTLPAAQLCKWYDAASDAVWTRNSTHPNGEGAGRTWRTQTKKVPDAQQHASKRRRRLSHGVSQRKTAPFAWRAQRKKAPFARRLFSFTFTFYITAELESNTSATFILTLVYSICQTFSVGFPVLFSVRERGFFPHISSVFPSYYP